MNTKQLDKEQDIDLLPKEKDKVVEVKINTTEFDPTQCEYTSVEDIDDKMISYIEKEVRGSYEYKSYINYLKTELDLNQCELMPGLDPKTDPVSIEFHHYPITLYEIVAIVSNKLLSEIDEGESVSSFEISEQVMKEHYENNVGLVPLTSTLHEAAHSRSIIVPINTINGNYTKFINKYNDYINSEIMDKITDNITVSSDEELVRMTNSNKLNKKIMHYDINYVDRNKENNDFLDTNNNESTDDDEFNIDDLFDK